MPSIIYIEGSLNDPIDISWSCFSACMGGGCYWRDSKVGRLAVSTFILH